MSAPAPERRTATIMGVLALVLWSTTVALSRSVSESLGTTTAGAATLLVGGGVGCLWLLASPARRAALRTLPLTYLVGCGVPFVAYMVCLYLAIGLAESRQQVIEVGVINYLWPGLTLALSVPVLRTRVRRPFALGVLLLVAGAALAPLQLGQGAAPAAGAWLAARPLPYVLALVAAVSWALYSVLSRRLAGGQPAGAVPVFTLAAGLALAAIRATRPESSSWSVEPVATVMLLALFPVLVAYGMWERAMRQGDVSLVATLSNLTPVLSTLISSVYLAVAPGWNLWVACALVAGGAWLCRRMTVAAE